MGVPDFFNKSPIDRCLSCFLSFIIKNSTAMNICFYFYVAQIQSL